MQATNLKTNHLTQPLGMDAGTLFLSWQCAEGVRQTAYEIEVTAGAETLWTSGKILSSMMHLRFGPAEPAPCRSRSFLPTSTQCGMFYRRGPCMGRRLQEHERPGQRR